jgi:hypothetical protein
MSAEIIGASWSDPAWSDPAWGNALAALAKIDPAAAARAVDFAAQRSGAFVHLNSPESLRAFRDWHASQAVRRPK